jgi:hypothetical protein
MPNRVIREGLWDSDAFIGLRDNGARICYLRLLSKVDDHGNADGSMGQLQRMWRDFGIETHEKVAKTLHELVDAKLIGQYIDGAKEYVHVFNFRQRIRIKKHRVPASPWDDIEDKGVDIQVLGKKTSDTRQSDVRHATDIGRPVLETKRNETESETKPKETKDLPPESRSRGAAICSRMSSSFGFKDVNPTHAKLAALIAAGVTDAEFDEAAQIALDADKGFAYMLGVAQGRLQDAKRTPKANAPPWFASDKGIDEKGRELGLNAKPGESWQQFRERINAKLTDTAKA